MSACRSFRLAALCLSLGLAGCADSTPTQPSPIPSADQVLLRVNIFGTPTRNQTTEVGVTIPMPASSSEAAIARLSIDWGDGSSSDLMTPEVSREHVLSHVYTTSRTYTMTVTVTRGDQRVERASFIVPVR